MASSDDFAIAVTGRGGHAAQPHNAIDPVVAGSQIVLALQTIASRNVDPLKSVVVSVTMFETDSNATNVIPEHVTLGGTVRTLDPEVRDLVESADARRSSPASPPPSAPSAGSTTTATIRSPSTPSAQTDFAAGSPPRWSAPPGSTPRRRR